MSERKIFFLTLSIIAGIVLILAAFSYFVSGIREYSDQLFSLTDGRKYNSQIIRKFSFDTMLLGSSMSQGFKCSEFDAAFGGQSIKLAVSAANFMEIREFLNYALKYKKIKRVMFDAPVDFFAREQSLKEFPTEYYGENVDFVRLKKSFSVNALVDEFDFFWDYLRGKVKYTTRDALYDWNPRLPCNEKRLAMDLLYSTGNRFLSKDGAYKLAVDVAEKSVLPMINAHPDIEFVIFFPPYCMMFYRDVEPAEYIALKRKITDLLLTCPNVKLYDFETAFPIMQKLSNYKDRIHYSGAINTWMIQQMKDGKYLVTPKNKDSFSGVLEQELRTYDFQGEFNRLSATYGKQ